jgi:hypothetical protein
MLGSAAAHVQSLRVDLLIRVPVSIKARNSAAEIDLFHFKMNEVTDSAP